MRVAALHHKKFEVEEREKPILDTEGAIIRVIGCGLCGSDIVKYTHKLVKDGAVLGHEVVGEIIELNSDLDFKIGDKVTLGHHYPCFECNYCKHGNFSMCETFKKSNIIPGGFSEYIKIDENHLKYTVFKIPEGMDLITASFTEPLACCHRAVERMNILENDKILIIGLGSIGILMGQAAKTFGAKVYGLDINNERLNIARQYGFNGVYQTLETFEADGIFLTAGADKSIESAINNIRKGGKICVFASTKTDAPAYQNNKIYYNELTVYSSYSSAPHNLKTSFKLLKDNKVNVENLTKIYDITELNQAISDTMQGKILKAFIKVAN